MTAQDRIGGYTLVKQIGKGYTGSTWIAETLKPVTGEAAEGSPDPTREAPGKVVLKILDLGEAPSWSGVDLFRREAEVLRGLRHPGLPRYLEFFEDAKDDRIRLVLVMECIEGQSLQALVEGGNRFTDVEIETILAELAEILAYLGSLRPPVVHRDVNPKNILQRPGGRVALVDFSGVQEILRLASNPGSTLVGTAGNTPLEQVAGKATTRSDLYGAATTALFLLTRRNPSELPLKSLKPDLGIINNLSPRLVKVLDSWLEPDETRRTLGPLQAAAILRGTIPAETARTVAAVKDRDPIYIDVSDTEAAAPRTGNAASLPSDSRIVLERSEERLRIKIPPSGVRGPASLSIGGFAIFWLAFVAFWTFGAAAMGAPIFFTMFSLPFWAVGLFLIKTAFAALVTSVELILDRGSGARYTVSVLGMARRRSWPLSDIGRCSVTNIAIQAKGGNEREISIEAGVKGIKIGRGLSERELRTLNEAIGGWLREARG